MTFFSYSNKKQLYSHEEYDFVCIHNIDEMRHISVVTFRECIKTWNATVQYWMVANVYKRLPVEPLSVMVVMVVSAFWHGVHPGYYLSFLSMPFIVFVENFYDHHIRTNSSTYVCITMIVPINTLCIQVSIFFKGKTHL